MREKTEAVVRIGAAYLLWTSLDQWIKIIQPYFFARKLHPRPNLWQVSLITSLGHFFTLFGTFGTAFAMDTVGHKATAIAISIVTGALFIVTGLTRSLPVLLGLQIARVGSCFMQVMEALLGGMHGEADGRGRLRSIMWASIPHGIGMVLGPTMVYATYTLLGSNVANSYSAAGVLMIVVLVPMLFAVVPDQPQRSRQFTAPQNETPKDFVSSYKELLGNSQLCRVLVLRLLFDLPMQSFEALYRFYLLSIIEMDLYGMIGLGLAVGASALLTNTVLINQLQQRLSQQHILMVSFGALTVSYAGLSVAASYWLVLLSLTIHVIGATFTWCLLSAQAMSSVESHQVPKAAGLSSLVSTLAATLAPVLGGLFVRQSVDFYLLLRVSAVVSAAGVGAAHLMGGFLRTTSVGLLPASVDDGKFA